MHSAELCYYILFLLSAALTCVYVMVWHKHFSVTFSLLFAFIPIVTVVTFLSLMETGATGFILIDSRMSFEKADSIMMESMGKHFDKKWRNTI